MQHIYGRQNLDRCERPDLVSSASWYLLRFGKTAVSTLKNSSCIPHEISPLIFLCQIK